jgi:uncharacterized protein
VARTAWVAVHTAPTGPARDFRQENDVEKVTIHKLNSRGETVFSYTGEVVERFPNGVRIEARWERAVMDLGYVRFEPGDRFIEWYFSDRWYNIFEIRAHESNVRKGWYCNVTAPATITDEHIMCRDLVLDLWVSPDGQTLVLDEDEFAEDTSMDAPMRENARRGLATLIACVREGKAPFDGIGS